MKTPHFFLLPSSLFLLSLALSAAAAEVVVYSPYCEKGFTLKAPSGVYHYPAEFTGHRAVCAVPDADTNAVYEAWTGDETFTAGTDFYGTSAGRATPTIDVTRLSPVTPRVDMLTPSGDRGKSITDYCDNLWRIIKEAKIEESERELLLDRLKWTQTHRWDAAKLDAAALENVRVRVVRWVVDGNPVYRYLAEPEIVLDQKMRLSNRSFLSEADFLATGALDLDWDNLKSGVVDNFNIQCAEFPVTNMAYLVVIGDGKTFWESDTDTNSVPVILDWVIERKFGFDRLAPTPVSGSFDGDVARFRFRIDGDAIYDDETPTYTAFQVAVRVSGATANVWTSGIKRLPAKDPEKKVYAYSTDDAALAAAISSGKSYVWLCALYNAKYPDTPTEVSSNGWSSATLTVK